MLQKTTRNLIIILALLSVMLAASALPGQATLDEPQTDALYVWRLYLRQPQDTAFLTSGMWDVLEARGPDYLQVMGSADVADQLRALGFRVTLHHEVTQRGSLAYFDGYRTVAEHYQHMDDIVALHPSLAVTVTYGASWERTQSASAGHDLRAICITHLRPGDCALNPHTDKPRFFLMAAIHARELSTSELAWRWMDYLVNNNAHDADIWALLEHNEMWIVPVANPDGRVAVESGGNAPLYQRKNTNTSNGVCGPLGASNQPGIDLNRNASFKWGESGSSTEPCYMTYHGPYLASEPEQAALESLMSALFHDQRGPLDTDAAPITTTGAMISLHSYSDLVLLPLGWTQCYGYPCNASLRAPNDTELRGLAFHMSYHNGYFTGQASEALYPASGTTDDWAYGVLGIPGFTFEVGPNDSSACGDFMPEYACQDSLFWRLNRGAFLYLAKVARQPYALALGPVVDTSSSVLVAPISGTLHFTATIAADRCGNSGYDRPAVNNIQAASFSINTPPWISTSISISMTATDGTFDSPVEVVSGALPQLPPGMYTIYIHGQDAAGNWGPTTAQWILVPRQQLLLLPVFN